MDGIDRCVIRNTIQEFCMCEKKALQNCYQRSKSKHIFLGKEVIAYGSKESRFWVEKMLDQRKIWWSRYCCLDVEICEAYKDVLGQWALSILH